MSSTRKGSSFPSPQQLFALISLLHSSLPEGSEAVLAFHLASLRSGVLPAIDSQTPHLLDTLRLVLDQAGEFPVFSETFDRVCEAYPGANRVRGVIGDEGAWRGWVEVLRLDEPDVGHAEVTAGINEYLAFGLAPEVSIAVQRVMIEERMYAELEISHTHLAEIRRVLGEDNSSIISLHELLAEAYAQRAPWWEAAVSQVAKVISPSHPEAWGALEAILLEADPTRPSGLQDAGDGDDRMGEEEMDGAMMEEWAEMFPEEVAEAIEVDTAHAEVEQLFLQMSLGGGQRS